MRSTGCYDEVLVYEDVASCRPEVPSVYVDMSGNAALRAAVHEPSATRCSYSCSVGGTHWDDLGGAKGLAGPRPVLFFAPAQGAKRRQEWGADGFDRRLADAWHDFVRAVTHAATALAGGGTRGGLCGSGTDLHRIARWHSAGP